MSGRTGLDASSKLGRAVFSLVDASQKMSVDIRTRVVRVRNLVEPGQDDPMSVFKIGPDLNVLMRESRLNPHIRARQKALRQE